MYEQFFDLKRRPFAATPDPSCWFRNGGFQGALDQLLVCAEQGQGIGILTAPSGSGKTLICERLTREINDELVPVLLRHTTYHSRRAFLQTLLSEIGQPFDRPTDQELRLVLEPALRELGRQSRALLLVIDEAHLLHEKLLEELRILADFAIDGRPLVRLVLSGHMSLEDKLTHQRLQALSQRLRAQVSLQPLTLADALDYLDYRITWAGGRMGEIFSVAAAESIARAADGSPRCLNQLADHTLLLAYAKEERLVNDVTAAEALEDLQHLPLAWHRSLRSLEPVSWKESPVADTWGTAVAELSPSSDVDETMNFVEFESPLPSAESVPAPPSGAPISEHEEIAVDPEQLDDVWNEEIVVDRYTALDAGQELPPTIPTALPMVPPSQPTPDDFDAAAVASAGDASDLLERIDALQQLIQQAETGTPAVSDRHEGRSLPTPDDSSPTTAPAATVAFEFGAPSSTPSAATASQARSAATQAVDLATAEPVSPTMPESRSSPSIKNLFTLLRKKQLGQM